MQFFGFELSIQHCLRRRKGVHIIAVTERDRDQEFIKLSMDIPSTFGGQYNSLKQINETVPRVVSAGSFSCSPPLKNALGVM